MHSDSYFFIFTKKNYCTAFNRNLGIVMVSNNISIIVNINRIVILLSQYFWVISFWYPKNWSWGPLNCNNYIFLVIQNLSWNRYVRWNEVVPAISRETNTSLPSLYILTTVPFVRSVDTVFSAIAIFPLFNASRGCVTPVQH